MAQQPRCVSFADSIDALKNEFGLSPVMGAEIECYALLADERPETMDAFWRPIDAQLRAAGVALLRIEKETGDQQYELVTNITTPEQLAEWLATIKSTIEAQGRATGIRVSFAAKAFQNQPPSGMHLHIHLADAEGINAYHKTEEWTSDALRWSLGGLLTKLPEQMPIFCPHDYSVYRFDDADHVPKLAGWGVNNRYCALRIPAIEDPYDKRIEHRVPGADADPHAAIGAVLEAVLHGLRNKVEPPPQEHGKPKMGLVASLAAATGGQTGNEAM